MARCAYLWSVTWEEPARPDGEAGSLIVGRSSRQPALHLHPGARAVAGLPLACAHELAEALHAGSSRKAVILPRALGDEIQAVVHGGPCLRADLTIDREKVILLVALH